MTDLSGIWRGYWLYLCNRKLRLVRLAGAFDTGGLEHYFQYAVRLLFETMCEAHGGAGGSRSEAGVRCSVGYECLDGDVATSFELGSADRGVLSAATVLGTAVAEAVPRLDIEVTSSLGEWKLLMEDAESLANLEEACRIAVPLSMTYRMRFVVRPSDWCSRLGAAADGRENEEKLFVLGISSGLGCA